MEHERVNKIKQQGKQRYGGADFMRSHGLGDVLATRKSIHRKASHDRALKAKQK